MSNRNEKDTGTGNPAAQAELHSGPVVHEPSDAPKWSDDDLKNVYATNGQWRVNPDGVLEWVLGEEVRGTVTHPKGKDNSFNDWLTRYTNHGKPSFASVAQDFTSAKRYVECHARPRNPIQVINLENGGVKIKFVQPMVDFDCSDEEGDPKTMQTITITPRDKSWATELIEELVRRSEAGVNEVKE